MNRTSTKVITPPCVVCNQESEVKLTLEEYRRLTQTRDDGRPFYLIQDALPERDAGFRELVKTGTHPACWDAMFASAAEGDDAIPTPTSGLLVVPVEGPTFVVGFVPGDSLGVLQEHVQGYVECVDVGTATTTKPGVDMWLNEEGKFRADFAQNERAQLLWNLAFGAGSDYIMGPAVLARHDDEGETIALSEDDITELRATFDTLGLEA